MIIKIEKFILQLLIAFAVLNHSVEKILYDKCKSNVGKEFLVLIPDNTRNDANPLLFLSTPIVKTVYVHIETPLTNLVYNDVTVSNGSEAVVDIPLSVAIDGTTKSNQAIHIIADDFITVYASSIQNNGGDSFIIYPVEILGTEYVTVNLETNSGFDSVISMIAMNDNTQINITLPYGISFVYESITYDNNSIFSVYLNKFEAFQITHENDLSGTIISSNSSVAVFSGHELGRPLFSTQTSVDTLFEMLLPVNFWSTMYVVVTNPVFTSGDGDEISIYASEKDTAVQIEISGTTTQVVIGGKGQFHRFHLQFNSCVVLRSDKRILVSQISSAKQVVGSQTGDSYLVLPTPVNSWLNEYTFTTPGRLPPSADFRHGLVLIANSSSLDKIFLNNAPLDLALQWSLLDNTDYSYTNIQLTEGVQSLTCVSSRCWGYVYGIDSLDGYGTAIGRSFIDNQSKDNSETKYPVIIPYTKETTLKGGIERAMHTTKQSFYPSIGPVYQHVTRSLVNCFMACMLHSCSVVAFHKFNNTCNIYSSDAVCDTFNYGSDFHVYFVSD